MPSAQEPDIKQGVFKVKAPRLPIITLLLIVGLLWRLLSALPESKRSPQEGKIIEGITITAAQPAEQL